MQIRIQLLVVIAVATAAVVFTTLFVLAAHHAEQAEVQRQFGLIAIFASASMLAALAVLALIVQRRLLAPLAGLGRAAAAVQRGDLSYRLANPEPDELGDLARQFDAMTAALAEARARMLADIAAREHAELHLTRSEQRLLALTNNIPAMVGYFDMEERCRYANDSGLNALGLARSDLAGLTLRAALGEANYAQHEPYVREALAGRRARLNGKIPFQGRTAYFQAHLIPDRADGGAQRGFFLMSFDITALQEAQLRQVHVESQLRAVTDNLPALIAYVDADERYAFMNRTFLDWFGVEPASILGRTVAEVIGPELYEQRREGLRRALGGERVTFELESQTLGARRSLRNLYIPDIQSDGTVAGLYALSTDITPLKAVERELVRLARSDALTGLPNRLRFDELLPPVLARSRRSGMAIALMFLDIDHFKSINDTHGHAAGDAVLREFAERLRHGVRVTDTVARLAGDEFVITLEDLHEEAEAQAVARKIVSQVRRPFAIEGIELVVTTSIGIAYHRPADAAATPASLLANADRALYAAKQAGRDGFRLVA